MQKSKKWAEIAERITVVAGTNRSDVEVRKKWQDFFSLTRKKALQLRHQATLTGAGVNRLRTSVGQQCWGITDSAQCECGDTIQTVEHILTSCPKHRPPNGERGLIDLDHRTLDGLASTELKV